MKIAVIDDYQGVFRELSNFHRLSAHEVVTFSEPERDMDRLAERLREFEVVVIVNTSRAPIIAEGALVEALRRGRPGSAAVDVYEDEPVLGAEHPLLQMANVIATPHLGYVTRDRYESMYGATIEHILAFAKGSPILVANPAVLAKG